MAPRSLIVRFGYLLPEKSPRYFIDYQDEEGGLLGVWDGESFSAAVVAALEWTASDPVRVEYEADGSEIGGAA